MFIDNTRSELILGPDEDQEDQEDQEIKKIKELQLQSQQ